MLDKVGPEKVIVLVTDDAANMKKARSLVVKMDRFKHITEGR